MLQPRTRRAERDDPAILDALQRHPRLADRASAWVLSNSWSNTSCTASPTWPGAGATSTAGSSRASLASVTAASASSGAGACSTRSAGCGRVGSARACRVGTSNGRSARRSATGSSDHVPPSTASARLGLITSTGNAASPAASAVSADSTARAGMPSSTGSPRRNASMA